MPFSQDYSQAIIFFESLCGPGATTTVHNINSAMREGTTSTATVHRWFARFKEGDTGFEDKARPGPPPPPPPPPAAGGGSLILDTVEEDPEVETGRRRAGS
ncbi:unnamed protein product [Haemonchus placei]|uniref:HTH_48 domain-containing protein n=1 Tax=Haemonchus placei TaxID=6290 RepID=A0A0N4WD62_HAEPC|nr:unnamed protein product [Haemonchus placei]